MARELWEELGITADASALAPIAFGTGLLEKGRSLILLLFGCKVWEGEPRALQASALRWLLPDDLPGLAMPPADLPLVQALRRR